MTAHHNEEPIPRRQKAMSLRITDLSEILFLTTMSVLLIVRPNPPKCTLVASHAVPWWVTVSMLTGQSDCRTDGRTPDRYITLSARRGQRNERGDTITMSICSSYRRTVRRPETKSSWLRWERPTGDVVAAVRCHDCPSLGRRRRRCTADVPAVDDALRSPRRGRRLSRRRTCRGHRRGGMPPARRTSTDNPARRPRPPRPIRRATDGDRHVRVNQPRPRRFSLLRPAENTTWSDRLDVDRQPEAATSLWREHWTVR